MNRAKWRTSWKKFTFIAFITTLISLLILPWGFITYDRENESRDQLYCFELSSNMLPELDENEPKLGLGIYFHESSCSKDISDVSLNARQSCSVESALRAHPNMDVFLLIPSPVSRPLADTKNILLKSLLAYKNFKLRHITFSKYLSNTPLHSIYTSGALNFSLWPIQHSSDVLRYATLYKFGGIYLDLDVTVLKSLAKLKNFAGAESNDFLGSGILGFSSDEIGREVAEDCARELARTYQPKLWGYNGPGVVTRVLERRCKTSIISNMVNSYCGGFQVFPKNYFSAIPYNESNLFFTAGYTEKVRKILNESYTIHFWNKMSYNFVLDNQLDIPYLKYAEQYCPRVYEAANGNFNLQ